MYMIKSIQLLKESFATYKANIKNIIFMTWPILLLTLVSAYYSNGMDGMGKEKPLIVSFMIIGIIVVLLTSLLISLFFQPALYRSIQQKENDKDFDTKDGYSFAKKNIWNFIVLIFWGVVYSIKVNLRYILTMIVALIAWGIVVFNIKTIPILISTSSILGIIVIICVLFMVIKNFTKFVLYTNIFFSGDIKPKDSVLHSIELGKKHNKNIWKIVWSVVLFSLMTYVIYGIIGLIASMATTKEVVDIIAMVVTSIVVSFLTTPMSFIILAKGYSKINSATAIVAEEVRVEEVTA